MWFQRMEEEPRPGGGEQEAAACSLHSPHDVKYAIITEYGTHNLNRAELVFYRLILLILVQALRLQLCVCFCFWVGVQRQRDFILL